MRFPSLSSLLDRAGRSLIRFPLAILLASTATTIAVYLIQRDGRENEDLLTRCLNATICCYLGMLLSIAMTVWAERKGWGWKAGAGVQLGVLAATVVYYFLMPDHFETKTMVRWMLYGLGLHWLIAVIAFAGGERIEAFWQFNKDIFIRILTSVLYTLVLYMGLALALLAIEHLFNVPISYKWYGSLSAVLFGVFNTWVFLAGFPSVNSAGMDYPKGLRIFTQYVLLPILMVYMGILYVYLFKIVVTAHWPVGWVAYLVLGFSVAGVLALLLIYPLRTDEKNKWINGYARFFYLALLPLLVMLGLAIWKRVKEYGITELRYFVIALTLWLAAMAVYFLASRKKNIQLIPLSLCLIAFLCSFGPWGVFKVSRSSQHHRLQTILEKNGLLKNGKVTKAEVKLSHKDREEITSITEYIVGTHGYETLQPWFHENLDSLMRKDGMSSRYSGYPETQHILALMNVEYTSSYGIWDGENTQEEPREVYFSYTLEEAVAPTDGLSYLIPDIDVVPTGEFVSSGISFHLDKGTLDLSLDSSLNQLHLAFSGGAQAPGTDGACVVDLGPLLHGAGAAQYNKRVALDKMTLSIHCPGWDGKMVVSSLTGLRRQRDVHVTELKGQLLLGAAK